MEIYITIGNITLMRIIRKNDFSLMEVEKNCSLF